MKARNHIKELFGKYLDNKCTPLELEILIKYFAVAEEGQLRKLIEGALLLDQEATNESGHEIKLDSIFYLINHKIKQGRKQAGTPLYHTRTWRPGRLAAASVLLIAFCCGYYFLNKKTPALPPIKPHVAKNVISPGGNKAVLTLANGETIVLTDAVNGRLASEGNTVIDKTTDGEIKYILADRSSEHTVQYNTMTTPRGGQYLVVLPDGSKVLLNAASSLTYPTAFKANERKVELSGEAYFEIEKDKNKPFLVSANGVTVKVYGTHFNINAYNDNSAITTTLLEGSVRMQKENSSVMLIPGQQGQAKNNGSSINVSKADIEETMAWKSGRFIFHNESIECIMKQVSRWYDVDVTYYGNVKQKKFGGSISKYKDVTELLNNIQLTQLITYKIEGRRVIIME